VLKDGGTSEKGMGGKGGSVIRNSIATRRKAQQFAGFNQVGDRRTKGEDVHTSSR